ncbi:hypothetical protein SPAN111604_02040 [Sphingomonas antarctica]|uniref:hypothetical protein n=1 Tax=Sphingomonas antarctica TaxID=2040274 RepID=UPI0039E7C4E5
MVEERRIENIEIARLKPAPRNARTHSKRQIEQMGTHINVLLGADTAQGEHPAR